MSFVHFFSHHPLYIGLYTLYKYKRQEFQISSTRVVQCGIGSKVK